MYFGHDTFAVSDVFHFHDEILLGYKAWDIFGFIFAPAHVLHQPCPDRAQTAISLETGHLGLS